MYSTEQRIAALKLYHQIGSVTETVRILEYPTREHLRKWIREENISPKQRKPTRLINTVDHPRNPPAEFNFVGDQTLL